MDSRKYAGGRNVIKQNAEDVGNRGGLDHRTIESFSPHGGFSVLHFLVSHL